MNEELIEQAIDAVFQKLMVEVLITGIFEGAMPGAEQSHPRGKDGKFTAKGRAELKYAHGDFLLKGLARRVDKIGNGNVKRSAQAQLKKLSAHSAAMVQAIHHPEVGDDGNPTYAAAHRAHAELVVGARAFGAQFKADLGTEP